jgi:NADPH-dependent FMN reductase
MKKVTAFIGTASKKATYQAVQEFEQNLKQYGDSDFETVFLSEYHLELCWGCKQCFMKGEQYCPLQDDRDVLLKKMEQSDGIIFAKHGLSCRKRVLSHDPGSHDHTATGNINSGNQKSLGQILPGTAAPHPTAFIFQADVVPCVTNKRQVPPRSDVPGLSVLSGKGGGLSPTIIIRLPKESSKGWRELSLIFEGGRW